MPSTGRYSPPPALSTGRRAAAPRWSDSSDRAHSAPRCSFLTSFALRIPQFGAMHWLARIQVVEPPHFADRAPPPPRIPPTKIRCRPAKAPHCAGDGKIHRRRVVHAGVAWRQGRSPPPGSSAAAARRVTRRHHRRRSAAEHDPVVVGQSPRGRSHDCPTTQCRPVASPPGFSRVRPASHLGPGHEDPAIGHHVHARIQRRPRKSGRCHPVWDRLPMLPSPHLNRWFDNRRRPGGVDEAARQHEHSAIRAASIDGRIPTPMCTCVAIGLTAPSCAARHPSVGCGGRTAVAWSIPSLSRRWPPTTSSRPSARKACPEQNRFTG